MPSETAQTRPRLLLIEDNPDNQEILHYQLRDIYDIVLASDGAAALSQIALATMTGAFDIIVADVAMMYVDGIAFVKCFRCFESHEIFPRKAQVMFHTGHPDLLSSPELLERLGIDKGSCYVKGKDTERLIGDLHRMAGELNLERSQT